MSMRFRRRLLPLFLAALGLWGLAGCFYLPTPEHRADSKQKDFRELVGDGGSKGTIRPRVSTRESVTAILGPARWASKDRRSLAYTLHAVRAAWVYPLCFAAEPASLRVYAVRFDFDDNDVLVAWNLVHVDADIGWFKGVPNAGQNAIDRLNQGAMDSARIEPAMRP